MTKNVVGKNIRRLRERLGLTQEELALRCDLTQGYINFLENGKRGYTQRSLTRIAEALGVNVSRLFEERKRPAGVAEPTVPYGKRGRIYDEIIALFERLPDAVVEHYRLILAAEVSIRERRIRSNLY